MSEQKYYAGDLSISDLTRRIRFSVGRLTVEGDISGIDHQLAYWPTQDEGESGNIPRTTRVDLLDGHRFTLPDLTTIEYLD